MKDGAEYCVYTIRQTKYNVGTVKKESNFIYYFSTEEWNAGDWKEFPTDDFDELLSNPLDDFETWDVEWLPATLAAEQAEGGSTASSSLLTEGIDDVVETNKIESGEAVKQNSTPSLQPTAIPTPPPTGLPSGQLNTVPTFQPMGLTTSQPSGVPMIERSDLPR